MKADIDRVTKLLTDTVMLLCKNGLTYDRELKIQGLLAITLDTADVFVVQISESFESPAAGMQTNEKSLTNAEKSSADKQASRKRIAPTTSRHSEEIVDLTRLAETPLAELPLGHSRNANFQRHSVPPSANAMTMMRPPARGPGFPIGSCWPLGANQFLDVPGLNHFPNMAPAQNFGFGVRDATFADQNSIHSPLNYWTNTRQPNPGGFHCPLPANKPSRDLSVPALRWQYNSNFTMPNAVPGNHQRMMGPRHSSQRGLDKLPYTTDVMQSFGGTAAEGNFRLPVCAPRHRQPLQMTMGAPTLPPVERNAPQVDGPSRGTTRMRDAGFSQYVVACPDPGQTSSPTAGAGGCSSFTGVVSCAGRPLAAMAGSVMAPVIKPCLSPVPVSSNNCPLDLSDGVHTSARNSGSTSAPLPFPDPSDQLTNSFQGTSGSVDRISELVSHISEVVNHGSRSVNRDSVALDGVCIPANDIPHSADNLSISVNHGSNLPNSSQGTIPTYAVVTIIPDDIDDISEQDSFPLNEDSDVKMAVTSGGNECEASETGRVTKEIMEVLRQQVTQDSTHNLTSEPNQGITREIMPQLMNEAATRVHLNNEVHEICLDSCPVTSGEDSEAGNSQVSDCFEQVTQQLAPLVPAQNDITEYLPVLTKVVPTEATNMRLAPGLDVLTMGVPVDYSGSLIPMPKLQKSENWSCSHFDEEQEREETLMEETSLVDPCISLTSTSVVDTRVSVDPAVCVVDCMQEALDYPARRSYCEEFTTRQATTKLHQPPEVSIGETTSVALVHSSETKNLTSVSSDNSIGVLKQPVMLENIAKASGHTFVSTNLLSTASPHPPEVMDNLMIESEALLCPSESSDPPSMELIDPSDDPPFTTSVFDCKSKYCPNTYGIASDLAFHYMYQHPELIASDLISGNRKTQKYSTTRNAYAKSLRASTASKREYSEQTRGLRDPSLVHPCAAVGRFVHHRPKNFPCPKVGCTKKYSCEKRLANHLQIFHRRHPTNFRQLNSFNLQSNIQMDSSAGADNLGGNPSLRSNDGGFLCPKATCTKKYSSEKRLLNHLWICHHEHATNIGQMNSTDMRSDSKMNSSGDNLEANNSDRLNDSNMNSGRDSGLDKIVNLGLVEVSTSGFPGSKSSTPVV